MDNNSFEDDDLALSSEIRAPQASIELSRGQRLIHGQNFEQHSSGHYGAKGETTTSSHNKTPQDSVGRSDTTTVYRGGESGYTRRETVVYGLRGEAEISFINIELQKTGQRVVESDTNRHFTSITDIDEREREAVEKQIKSNNHRRRNDQYWTDVQDTETSEEGTHDAITRANGSDITSSSIADHKKEVEKKEAKSYDEIEIMQQHLKDPTGPTEKETHHVLAKAGEHDNTTSEREATINDHIYLHTADTITVRDGRTNTSASRENRQRIVSRVGKTDVSTSVLASTPPVSEEDEQGPSGSSFRGNRTSPAFSSSGVRLHKRLHRTNINISKQPTSVTADERRYGSLERTAPGVSSIQKERGHGCEALDPEQIHQNEPLKATHFENTSRKSAKTMLDQVGIQNVRKSDMKQIESDSPSSPAASNLEYPPTKKESKLTSHVRFNGEILERDNSNDNIGPGRHSVSKPRSTLSPVNTLAKWRNDFGDGDIPGSNAEYKGDHSAVLKRGIIYVKSPEMGSKTMHGVSSPKDHFENHQKKGHSHYTLRRKSVTFDDNVHDLQSGNDDLPSIRFYMGASLELNSTGYAPNNDSDMDSGHELNTTRDAQNNTFYIDSAHDLNSTGNAKNSAFYTGVSHDMYSTGDPSKNDFGTDAAHAQNNATYIGTPHDLNSTSNASKNYFDMDAANDMNSTSNAQNNAFDTGASREMNSTGNVQNKRLYMGALHDLKSTGDAQNNAFYMGTAHDLNSTGNAQNNAIHMGTSLDMYSTGDPSKNDFDMDAAHDLTGNAQNNATYMGTSHDLNSTSNATKNDFGMDAANDMNSTGNAQNNAFNTGASREMNSTGNVQNNVFYMGTAYDLQNSASNAQNNAFHKDASRDLNSTGNVQNNASDMGISHDLNSTGNAQNSEDYLFSAHDLNMNSNAPKNRFYMGVTHGLDSIRKSSKPANELENEMTHTSNNDEITYLSATERQGESGYYSPRPEVEATAIVHCSEVEVDSGYKEPGQTKQGHQLPRADERNQSNRRKYNETVVMDTDDLISTREVLGRSLPSSSDTSHVRRSNSVTDQDDDVGDEDGRTNVVGGQNDSDSDVAMDRLKHWVTEARPRGDRKSSKDPKSDQSRPFDRHSIAEMPLKIVTAVPMELEVGTEEATGDAVGLGRSGNESFSTGHDVFKDEHIQLEPDVEVREEPDGSEGLGRRISETLSNGQGPGSSRRGSFQRSVRKKKKQVSIEDDIFTEMIDFDDYNRNATDETRQLSYEPFFYNGLLEGWMPSSPYAHRIQRNASILSDSGPHTVAGKTKSRQLSLAIGEEWEDMTGTNPVTDLESLASGTFRSHRQVRGPQLSWGGSSEPGHLGRNFRYMSHRGPLENYWRRNTIAEASGPSVADASPSDVDIEAQEAEVKKEAERPDEDQPRIEKRWLLPNPYNKINQRCHSTLQCPCCLFFCFLCCLPAVHFMQLSDKEFDYGSERKSRVYGKRATFLYVLGAIVSLISLSAVASVVVMFLREYLTRKHT